MMTLTKQITLAFGIMLVLFSLSLAADLSETYNSSSPYHADFVQIQKLVMNLEQSIKEQNGERLLRHFLSDSTRPAEENRLEREGLTDAFARLSNTFSVRSTISNRAGYSSTRDFGVALKSLNFSGDGKQAWAGIYAGFSNLPGDGALLNKFSADEVLGMSDRDKEFNTKFRTCSLHLVKHDNTWLVRSYGDLSQVLSGLSAHQENVETALGKGKRK